jgi:cytochrome c-type biogenesis protein CcmH/NrfG
MNRADATELRMPVGPFSGREGATAQAAVEQVVSPLFGKFGSRVGPRMRRFFRGEERAPSILRNNTNLPVFLVLALGISLLCNFTLKESSAQASRYLSPAASIREVQALLAQNPDDPALHSRLGELYLQQRNYKRAMFYFRESSRLSELYGD